MTITAKVAMPDEDAPVVPAKPTKQPQRRNFAPGLKRLMDPSLEEELDRLGLRWFREECER